MLECNVPVREIAVKVGLSEKAVYGIQRRHKENGTIYPKPKSGRPKKLTERDARELVRTVREDPRASLRDITNSMATKVSVDTVRRALVHEGFASRIAVKKPFISDVNKAKRLAFALEHRNWTKERWRRVIWCDESTFEIGKNSRQVRVWRRVDEKYLPGHLAPTFKSGRSSLMIWGAISGYGKSKLAFMDRGRRTAVDYVDMVYRGPLLEMMKRVPGAILMEDGAMIHRSNAPKQWRELYMLEKLNWPAQSPDLNPIENLWKQMKDAVQMRPVSVRSPPDMGVALAEIWEAIPVTAYISLIDSMPERLQAVIDAMGGSTRW
jgi:transposase